MNDEQLIASSSRYGSGPLFPLQLSYDALGRRISKDIDNSGDWDCEYHYYYNGQQMIETRNGSNQTLKQHVWGVMYVDELLQIGINQDPNNANTGNTENVCERFFWACQDANFNVIGILSATGDLIERYEYTPYGQRTVYSRGWLLADANDDGAVNLWDAGIIQDDWGTGKPASRGDLDGDGDCDPADGTICTAANGSAIADDDLVTHPRLESFRSPDALTGAETTSICDIGHQGLMHDKEFGLIYNRARYLHPTLGRFLQRDPLGYADGMSLYEYVRSGPVTGRDPTGTAMVTTMPTNAEWEAMARRARFERREECCALLREYNKLMAELRSRGISYRDENYRRVALRRQLMAERSGVLRQIGGTTIGDYGSPAYAFAHATKQFAYNIREAGRERALEAHAARNKMPGFGVKEGASTARAAWDLSSEAQAAWEMGKMIVGTGGGGLGVAAGVVVQAGGDYFYYSVVEGGARIRAEQAERSIERHAHFARKAHLELQRLRDKEVRLQTRIQTLGAEIKRADIVYDKFLAGTLQKRLELLKAYKDLGCIKCLNTRLGSTKPDPCR